jgi:succinyl-diaminopimelate desuccinylase
MARARNMLSKEALKSRARLAQMLRVQRRENVAVAKRLLAVPSPNPPGDTSAIATEIEKILRASVGIDIERYCSTDRIHNVVTRIRGSLPGKRLVFNGHLDTFPLTNASAWNFAPLGEEHDGRLYGLGISDMKGGVAASLFAMMHLAAIREELAGEIVGTFAGDEETMGTLGTQFLLDHVPHARGDAMINADAGSPHVLRCGEKGMIWLELRAAGKSAHAAHVHLGESAIEKLISVIVALQSLRKYRVTAPQSVLDAIAASVSVSEQLSGVGESRVLREVTITFGTLRGGRLSNLVADEAQATADIRLPIGVSVAEIESQMRNVVASHQGVTIEISRRYEPTWTDPTHPVVQAVCNNCRAVLGVDPVVNMRVGASDARLYRLAGVPSVVCGLTPHNMGATDEYVEIEELMNLGEILALSAFDYLFESQHTGVAQPRDR